MCQAAGVVLRTPAGVGSLGFTITRIVLCSSVSRSCICKDVHSPFHNRRFGTCFG
jgi:hypothetical protein